MDIHFFNKLFYPNFQKNSVKNNERVVNFFQKFPLKIMKGQLKILQWKNKKKLKIRIWILPFSEKKTRKKKKIKKKFEKNKITFKFLKFLTGCN